MRVFFAILHINAHPFALGVNMITEIGIVAGEIWQYLDKNDSANLEDVVKEVGKSQELVLMSLGWLAREGHVTLGDPQEGYLISLTEQNLAT